MLLPFDVAAWRFLVYTCQFETIFTGIEKSPTTITHREIDEIFNTKKVGDMVSVGKKGGRKDFNVQEGKY